MPKPRIHIIVPEDDLSISLFFSKSCKAIMDVKSTLYLDVLVAGDEDWDFIYVRGPYVQADFDSQKLREYIDEVLKHRGKAYTVDGVSSFSDLFLEDKWRQYGLFADLMPSTKPLNSLRNISLDSQLIKKRISGRSRDIHFDIADLPESANPQDYILQRRLEIQTEYRAFMVGGELVLPLEIKTSKTERTKNKVIGMEPRAPEEVNEICQQVFAKLKFDLMGLDIVKTSEGFFLLEVNRSPQFINFFRLGSKNLAEDLYKHLLKVY